MSRFQVSRFSEGVVFGKASVYCRAHFRMAVEGEPTLGCHCARRRLVEVLSARLQAAARAPEQRLAEARRRAAAEVGRRGE